MSSTSFVGLILKRPRYIDCAIKVNDIIPWIKDNIISSDLEMIIVKKEDFARELNLDLSEVETPMFYQDLKFVLLVNGVVIKNGVDYSGKKLFIMKMATYKDKMPKYWKKRSKFFKQLMKSKEWSIILKNRNKPYVIDDVIDATEEMCTSTTHQHKNTS